MTLSILWFILIAVLWTMYMVLEGFDYGVGMLQGFLARDDRERTQALRTIGPHWMAMKFGFSPPVEQPSRRSPSGTPRCSPECTWHSS